MARFHDAISYVFFTLNIIEYPAFLRLLGQRILATSRAFSDTIYKFAVLSFWFPGGANGNGYPLHGFTFLPSAVFIGIV